MVLVLVQYLPAGYNKVSELLAEITGNRDDLDFDLLLKPQK